METDKERERKKERKKEIEIGERQFFKEILPRGAVHGNSLEST